MEPNEQGNESSVRQDVVRSDAGSASRERERKQPHWLLKILSAVLAPMGVSWAQKIQGDMAQAGRKKVDEVSGRGPKQR